MTHDPIDDRPIVAPFAKAYGVDHTPTQEALRMAAVVLLDQVLMGDKAAGDEFPVLNNVSDKEWIIALTIVGWKLAQSTQFALTNTLEEYACWAIYKWAQEIVPDEWDVGELDFGSFVDMTFDDLDFEPSTWGDEVAPRDEVKTWSESFAGGADPEHYGVSHPLLTDTGGWLKAKE